VFSSLSSKFRAVWYFGMNHNCLPSAIMICLSQLISYVMLYNLCCLWW
jgi:hypothetical protein